jgi:hypothetical protein
MHQLQWCRRAAGSVVAVAVGLVLAIGYAPAADWSERPFNPPIGSRWIIQSDETEKDEADGSVTGTSTKKITALLIYEEKLADGYRITYRRTDGSYAGDTDDPAVARAALAAMQGHSYRVVTDPAGMPLRVENLVELRAAVRKTIDDVAAKAGNAEVEDFVKKLMADLANVDEKQAAEHLDELPLLARGQNTGLRPSEVRRQTIAETVPGATPIQKTITLRIADIAPDGARVRLELVEVSDPESLKARMISLLGKLDLSNPAVREQVEAVKKMHFTQESRTEINVVDGMTRNLQVDSVTFRSLLGGTARITNRNLVTVSPAP